MIAPRENRGKGKKSAASHFGLARLVVWAVVGFAVAGIAYFFAMQSGAVSEKMEKKAKKGLIAEVKPEISQGGAEAEETHESVKAEPSREIPFWEQDNTNGFNSAMIKKWKFMHRPKPSFTNDMAKNMPKLECEIFDSRVENEIAVLMTLKPGASMVGMPKYGEEYEREFLESCEQPIIISEEDDEYTKQLKRDMIQVKIELMDRMRNGEKIGDIIREARMEAQRLSQLREDIVSTLRETIADADSDDDVDLLYESANKMLEAYGISPIKPLSISKYWLQRRLKDH